MFRLEVLDNKDRVLTTHSLGEGLTLVGQSPTADVHLTGKGIGALHVAIKSGTIMDLGGPTPLKINGKAALESAFKGEAAVLEIGSRKLRLVRSNPNLPRLERQAWKPLADEKSTTLVLRVRIYARGIPQDACNATRAFVLTESFGVPSLFRLAWIEGDQAFAQLPSEWIAFGGRIQAGGESIAQLNDWAQPTRLEKNKIYRVFAGAFVAELLVTQGQVVIGAARPEWLPAELRKPLMASLGSVLLVFALWMLIFGRPNVKVEEPYPVFARIQNIPVEKILEPEPKGGPQAGGGSGSESKETTSPQNGGAAAPSRLAQSLTGGLKSLVGNLLSQSKPSTVVVAENGVSNAAAPASAAPASNAGKLSAVGQGAATIAGATKLGKLAIAGSGKGFSGGSGAGLGTGAGLGIGSGVGNGIGQGGYKLIEEESIVDGGLDKSVIAAVIQNNLAQIKYCYERQLVAEPDLFGKVVVTWFINATGAVESPVVKQTTLNSPPVEQCMLTKISGWQFPHPKNGTRVTVTYPFLFKSTK